MAQAAAAPDWRLGPDLQREAQIQSAEISLLAILAAVQAVEKKMESQAAHLQNLEARTGTAEKKLASCEKAAAELGSQLEGKWAVLGTLLQECGLLQRRLENLETLLRGGRSWVLRLPPGSKGDAPQVPVTAEAEGFSERQGGSQEDWHAELCKHVAKGSQETSGCPETGWSSSVPQGLPWIKQEEGGRDEQDVASGPASSALTWPAGQEKRSPGAETEAAGGGRGGEMEEGRARGGPPAAPREAPAAPRAPDAQGRAGPAAGLPQGQTPQGQSRQELGAQRRPGPASAPRSAALAGRRAHTCSQCGKSFEHLSTLRAHHRTHTGERPHECAQCGKRFGRLSTLLEHRRTHTGERPFACAQCGRRFGRLSTLVEHGRTHTGEKPFPCAHCGKRFTRLATLTVHQGVHSAERAFPCAQCGASFARKPGLLRHLRGHSQEKRPSCGQCGRSLACRPRPVRQQGGLPGRACAACAGLLGGAGWGGAPGGPSAAPGPEGAGTERDRGAQPGGHSREGPGEPARSVLAPVKVENAG